MRKTDPETLTAAATGSCAELGRRSKAAGRRFRLITQNVDRLHQQAGSNDVVELYGSLWDWRCTCCGEQREERAMPFAEHPSASVSRSSAPPPATR